MLDVFHSAIARLRPRHLGAFLAMNQHTFSLILLAFLAVEASLKSLLFMALGVSKVGYLMKIEANVAIEPGYSCVFLLN